MYTLNDVCTKITDGSHFSPEDEGQGYPMFSVKDMQDNDFDFSACKHIGLKSYQQLVANDCRPLVNDVVVAKDGSYLKTAFPIKEDREIAVLSSIAILRPNITIVSPQYLSYYLKSISVYRTVSLNYITGTALKRVILAGLKKLPIQLPDLEEQKARAALLEKAQSIITKRKKQLEIYDALIKARFVEMFGDINVNSMNWPVQPLGELCTIVRGGSPRPIEQFLGGDVPWIKIGDATEGESIYLTTTKEHIIQEGVKKSRLVKAGSLIFANCGVSLGFARIITFDGCIHDGWLAMEDIDSKLNKIFLLQTLNQMTEHFREMAPAGTQPNLNTAIMKSYMQIIPPITLQEEYIDFVSQVDKSKVAVQAALEKAQLLFDSLMLQYFG